MQLKRTSRIVLSLTGQSIRYAKVHRSGNAINVHSQGEFAFDFQAFWSQPLTPQNALTLQLKAHGLSKGKAIIGVPAQWCLFDELRMPRLDEASLNSAIALQAEQRYNRSDRAFTCDYMKPMAEESQWSVTLAAMASAQLAALQFALDATSLKIQAIVPTSVVLHEAYNTDPTKRWQYTAWLHNDQIELFCWNQKRFAGMNLLQVTADHVNGDLHHHLYSAVRQQIQQDELIHAVDAHSQSVQMIWDHEHDCDVQWFAKPTDARRWQVHPRLPRGRSGAMVSNDLLVLGQLACDEKQPPLDFASPRLTRKQKQTTHPWRTRLALLGALVLLLIGYTVFDLYSLNQSITDLNQQISAMKDGTTFAKSIIQLVDRADHWFSTTPQYLACQRSISQAFGSTENVWATSLSLRADMQGLMNGSASTENQVLKLIDRMKAQPDLRDVKLLYMRDAATKNTAEIAYAVSFIYQPVTAGGVKHESE